MLICKDIKISRKGSRQCSQKNKVKQQETEIVVKNILPSNFVEEYSLFSIYFVFYEF